MMEKTCVFTYGTLMRGRSNHALLEAAEFVGAASIAGFALYDLGRYPGIIRAQGGLVKGECYRVNAAELAFLDELEEEGTLYKRIPVSVACKGEEIEAETYLYLETVEGMRFVPFVDQPWNLRTNNRTGS